MEREAKAARPTSQQAESTCVETSLPTAHDAQSADVSFPVIGIGASAGGLEADGQPQQSVESKAQSTLNKVVILLQAQTGNDFSEYKKSTRDGRWFAVRIMPYRTLENVIDGAVITLMDITASKVLEADLREKEHEVRALLASKAKTLETAQ